MSNKTEIGIWDEGVRAFEENDYLRAIEIWKDIADYSKIHFNLAIIFIKEKFWDDAFDALTRAIVCDDYLCVAYYVRAYCYYKCQDFEKCLDDYELCSLKMRSNTVVDYSQLGLQFKLFMSHVIFNKALCYFQLGQDAKGDSELLQAKQYLPQKKDDGNEDFSMIEKALNLGKGSIDYFEPCVISFNIIYKPPAQKVKNTEKVDYLGKSRVVAAANATDTFNGFSGTLIKKQTQIDAVNLPKMQANQPKSEAVKRSATVTISRNGTTVPQRKGSMMGGQSIRENNPQLFLRKGSLGSHTQSSSNYTSTNSSSSKTNNFDNQSVGWSSNGTSTTTSLDKIKVKCHFNDTRMILIPFDCQIENFIDKVKKKFYDQLSENSKLKLKYKDEDDELILITDQEDFVEALNNVGIEWGNFGGNNRFEIWCFT
ncbi:hypothetical protein HK099_003541 [Clydaea vesicula]|uniref:PB1 domain-containing protein n=1 Tax=Clydaea vesicula TaxID=447962 RepID=A0AAD5U3A6_9FUNG|nr:hypothetical protein HK099_003541 [Clydaea vesicula]KAJ3395641.1 hypothetical protein HDU92_005267 [Lobulomyces angularis]